MPSDDSITSWIGKLKAGDQAAVQQLWERYFDRLVRVARQRLLSSARRVADEDDAALSAFASFFRRIEQGRFPQLQDRNDLWRLLVVLTSRKSAKQQLRERRQKRGGGKVRGESAFRRADADIADAGIEAIAGCEPSPEFAVQVTEEFRNLLDRLGDDSLRQVALLKVEGYTNEEIAQRLDCAVRSVERKLQLIRAIWTKVQPHG